MTKHPGFMQVARFVAASIAAIALLASSADAVLLPQQTVIYAFHGSDGAAPYKLVEGADGVLYGAAAHGGAYGAGTVFALKPPRGGAGTWTLTLLASIPAGLSGQLFIDRRGNFALYGTVPNGGLPGPYGGYCDYWGREYGCGTAFLVTPPPGGNGAWTTTTIYSFTGGSDGGEPGGIAVVGGSMFGTAASGGTPDCYGQSGCGGSFVLSPPSSGKTAWTESLPIAFGPDNDGLPPSNQILGTGIRGDVFGVFAYSGGPDSVYRFGPGTFASFGAEGAPQGVVADEHGRTYIWTSTSGLYALFPPAFAKQLIYRLPTSGAAVLAAHWGKVYWAYAPTGKAASIVALLPPGGGGTKWTPRILSTFNNISDGANPNSIIFSKSGVLYGTTSAGGIANNGVIFRLPRD